jgi:hypothetical protein
MSGDFKSATTDTQGTLDNDPISSPQKEPTHARIQGQEGGNEWLWRMLENKSKRREGTRIAGGDWTQGTGAPYEITQSRKPRKLFITSIESGKALERPVGGFR